MDAAQSRRQFAYVLHHVERATNAQRRAFMQRMLAIVDDELAGDAVMTPIRYVRIRKRLDALMSEFYGDVPADPRARFMRLILDEAAFATQYAVAKERERFVRFVEDHTDALPRPSE